MVLSRLCAGLHAGWLPGDVLDCLSRCNATSIVVDVAVFKALCGHASHAAPTLTTTAAVPSPFHQLTHVFLSGAAEADDDAELAAAVQLARRWRVSVVWLQADMHALAALSMPDLLRVVPCRDDVDHANRHVIAAFSSGSTGRPKVHDKRLGLWHLDIAVPFVVGVLRCRCRME